MAGPGTSFVPGPVLSGNQNIPYGQVGSDQGLCVLMQTATLAFNGSTAASATFIVPASAQILDILVDTTTAWNSATSDTLSVGTAAAGTQYASGVDVKTAAGRIRPTFTAAQLANMASVGANTSVVATVTPVGAASAGATRVTLIYAQVVDLTGTPA